MSAVGGTETYRALARKDPAYLGFAAFDAGLVDVAPENGSDGTPVFFIDGTPISLAEIDHRFGDGLRGAMGIRPVPEDTADKFGGPDLHAGVPHDLATGGLRRQTGTRFKDVRGSVFKDMFGLFDEHPHLAPPVQAQLFLYGALGSLAALPDNLSRLVPDPSRFRIGAGTAFHGSESVQAWRVPMQGQVSPRMAGKRPRTNWPCAWPGA